MGDEIDSYLVSKGKPASLDSIPDLPYKLKCSKPYSCSFEKGGRVYQVWLDDNYYSFSLNLYTKYSKTGIYYTYQNKEKRYKLKYFDTYSSKKTGICNPMRQ